MTGSNLSRLRDRARRVLGQPCPYCGVAMAGDRHGHQKDPATLPTRDHINPRVRGGGPTIMVCIRCNLDKGGLELVEWAFVLRNRKDDRHVGVQALVDDLAAGQKKIVNSPWAGIGIEEGVFA